MINNSKGKKPIITLAIYGQRPCTHTQSLMIYHISIPYIIIKDFEGGNTLLLPPQ